MKYKKSYDSAHARWYHLSWTFVDPAHKHVIKKRFLLFEAFSEMWVWFATESKSLIMNEVELCLTTTPTSAKKIAKLTKSRIIYGLRMRHDIGRSRAGHWTHKGGHWTRKDGHWLRPQHVTKTWLTLFEVFSKMWAWFLSNPRSMINAQVNKQKKNKIMFQKRSMQKFSNRYYT